MTAVHVTEINEDKTIVCWNVMQSDFFSSNIYTSLVQPASQLPKLLSLLLCLWVRKFINTKINSTLVFAECENDVYASHTKHKPRFMPIACSRAYTQCQWQPKTISTAHKHTYSRKFNQSMTYSKNKSLKETKKNERKHKNFD